MDLNVEREQLILQKVSFFGQIQTVRVPITEMHQVSFQEAKKGTEAVWRTNRDDVNRDLIFRDSRTNEEFHFDENGLWNPEGLNHKLLNNQSLSKNE